ncbi:MAG: trypsin-like peptidase domain-containing protein, partial [Candidatus Phosphoribacter sp.]
RGHTLGLLAAVAVIGLLAGLVGGGLGSLLADRLTSVTQGGSPVPAPLPGATARPDGSIAKIAATALPSVVTVKISTGGTSGNGSGFVIDSAGHIVTNNHVVSGATGTGEITVELVDGTSLPATIVGRDASYDLAVLKVERTDLPPLTWGRSTDVVVGDGVIAVGAPLGLEATVTSGIVSALGRPVAAGGGDETSFINAIQTDAAINPGNSGGPLLDMSGRVVGVNSAIARDPGSTSGVSGSIGVGFAIPSDQAAKTAQQLIKTGKAQHPVIGVRLDRSFDGDGARITSPGGVTDGSAAQTAGLRDGDVVVSFEGKRVTGPDQLVVAIRARDVGDTVRLTVERDGSTTVITLTLQASD